MFSAQEEGGIDIDTAFTYLDMTNDPAINIILSNIDSDYGVLNWNKHIEEKINKCKKLLMKTVHETRANFGHKPSLISGQSGA